MKWIRAVVPVGLMLSAQVFSKDWPQYRGPAGDGKSPETMISVLPEIPQPRWKVPTPLGFSSFAVGNWGAYVIVRREVEGVPRDVLLALDPQYGKERWSVPLSPAKYDGSADAGTPQNSGGDGPRSSPAVDGNHVYILTADLLLACFDAAKGTEVWKRDLVKENAAHNLSWKNAASPVIDGDLVFVAGGGENQALLGINKNDGAVVWKGESDRMTHATPVVATIGGVKQVIFYTQKGLVAVKPNDGKVLWRHPVRYNVSTAASPVVSGDIVYCSAGYNVGATAIRVVKKGDSFSATELWKVSGNKLANHWSTPVEKDGYLYGMFQFKEYGDGPLKCVDIRTGKEYWAQPGFGPGQVIMVGDQLVALSDAGQVVVIEPSPEKYKEKARFQGVAGKCWSTPAFANGTLYVRSTREGAAYDLSQKQVRR
jgi:outer membrane protein assembly factor BamB